MSPKGVAFSICLAVIPLMALCWACNYYRGLYKEEHERAVKAEEKAATLEREKQKLGDALAEQEKATAEAQNNRRVVYRTVQKEVSSNADSRDWYNTAVPAGFVRVLKDGSKAGGNTRAAR